MALLDLVTVPVRLSAAAVDTTLALGHLVDPEGPVRREEGYADRVMLIIGRGGLVERLTRVLADPNGPMRLLSNEGALDRVTRQGGVLDRLLRDGGLLDRLLSEDGFADKLVAELAALIPELHHPVNTLNSSVGPLVELANRLPGGRRRPALEG